MQPMNRKFYEGKEAGKQAIAGAGIAAAQQQVQAAMPAGVPCALSIDDYKFWMGFRAAILEATP